MPIQAPKLTPATQVVSASGWMLWTQSSAEAASLKFADAVVEHALALADAAEIEAQGRKAALDEGLVEQLDDLVVHRPAGLRVRMEDQRDRRARAGAGMETAFEAAFGARENHFGHGWFGARVNMGGRRAGAPRQRVLYRGGCSCGNRQESTAFERDPTRLYLDHAATTPVLPEARAAMAHALTCWANPSSPHAEGRASRALLEEARGDDRRRARLAS